ncbi:uncharacterized protein VP01_7351g1, partial [Puccinia sorghi]
MISSSTQKTLTIMCSTFEKCLNVFEKTVLSSLPMVSALDWPQPTSVKTLQGFLGFANFYQNFFQNYSKTIVNLTSLLQEDTPFLFTEQSSKEFDALKKAFTTAPILTHFIAGIISQYSSSNLLHPVAFESQ